MADRDALISRILDAQRHLRRHLTDGGVHPILHMSLTMSQLKVMLILGRLGGASGQELARRTGVSLATLTGIVDRLVAQHLVSRREDPRDRRVRRLELTPTGADLVDRLIAAGEEQHQRLLQRLDGPALEVVAQAYELILDAAADAATAAAAHEATGAAAHEAAEPPEPEEPREGRSGPGSGARSPRQVVVDTAPE